MTSNNTEEKQQFSDRWHPADSTKVLDLPGVNRETPLIIIVG
jgi:hypothetical protein